MKRILLLSLLAVLTACGSKPIIDLPRAKAPAAMEEAFAAYLQAIADKGQDLHSIMIVQHGKVLEETWLGDNAADKAHILNSVSKTFTASAVGLAINEGLLSLDDKLISFFPDKLPAEISDNLAKVTVRHLLTMNCGHHTEPSVRRVEGADWVEGFLAHPVEHEPGTYFWYNSMGTYMLAAIVTKVTGEKVVDYLTPRLFEPLNIEKPRWDESPQGINCGGWGLYLKTEDLAKVGQLFLQGGKWNGKQILPAEWVSEAMKYQVPCQPASVRPEMLERLGMTPENSDWLQGYGYQMWRCRHNGVRADGANGQYIIILPDKDAVIATTANINDMQGEINLIWDYILPAL